MAVEIGEQAPDFELLTVSVDSTFTHKAGVVRWKVVNPIPEARDIADYQKALASLG